MKQNALRIFKGARLMMKFYFPLSNELSNELSKENEKGRVTVLNSCSVIFCSEVANRQIGQTITLPTEA